MLVARADPERVAAPCVHFRPGGCGGCDFQHASGARQRELKATVVAEQLRGWPASTLPVTVEELPGGGFGWRTRVRWALDPGGSDRTAGRALAPGGGGQSDGTLPDRRTRAGRARRHARGAGRACRRPASSGTARRRQGRQLAVGPPARNLPEVVLTAAGDGSRLAIWPDQPGHHDLPTVTEHAVGRDFSVAADGFWQVHPAAADTLAGAVAEALDGVDLVGGSAWDLYGGVGLFTEVLAEVVGATGSVISVEGDRTASALWPRQHGRSAAGVRGARGGREGHRRPRRDRGRGGTRSAASGCRPGALRTDRRQGACR